MTSRRALEVLALLTGDSDALATEIHTISGALHPEEREVMMQSYADYNLHLAFAHATGGYLADVAVAIHSADGRLLWSGISEGPFFFAQLPSGHYQVTVEFDGNAVTKKVQVGLLPGPMHHFRWKVLLN
jgi:hypothetical protein